METAAVAQVATAKGIDFVGIRSFSDMATKKTIHLLNLTKKQDESDEAFRSEVFKTPAKRKRNQFSNGRRHRFEETEQGLHYFQHYGRQ